jgi:predicted DCC family thiol-disulfide oxidoreductase YuxK
MTDLQQSSHSPLTVFYDGSCPLCTAEIGIYKDADTNDLLNMIDVSSHTFSGDDQITQQAAMARFHVRLEDGQQLSGARAFIEVWRVIPSWRWLAGFSKIPGAVSVLEFFYRAFLHARPLMVYLFKGIQSPVIDPPKTSKLARAKRAE